MTEIAIELIALVMWILLVRWLGRGLAALMIAMLGPPHE